MGRTGWGRMDRQQTRQGEEVGSYEATFTFLIPRVNPRHSWELKGSLPDSSKVLEGWVILLLSVLWPQGLAVLKNMPCFFHLELCLSLSEPLQRPESTEEKLPTHCLD